MSGDRRPEAAPPAVSVIVATRNRAHLLDDCLSSLAAQHVDVPFEVVVVDNGSSDGTAAVLAAWSVRDQRFRAVVEHRVGLSAAKNAGAAAARAPLLLFTDDDVIADPGFVAAHAAIARAQDGLAIWGGCIRPAPADLGSWPRWLPPDAHADVGQLDLGPARDLRLEYVWGANMAIPAVLFDQLGPWDETVGRRGDERGTFEDTEYQDRARLAGVPVRFEPGPVVDHRVERATVHPRGVLRTAYARAGYELRVRPGVEHRGHRSPTLRATLATFLLVLAQVGFAASGAPAAFRRSHAATLRAGRLVEAIDPVSETPRRSRPLPRILRRAAAISFRLSTTRPCGRRGRRGDQ